MHGKGERVGGKVEGWDEEKGMGRRQKRRRVGGMGGGKA